MNNLTGFYITELQVTGQNAKTAKLNFTKGFNVVSGLSDTGKSYVFACINYMLGGGDPPKEIPESNGYSDVWLELSTYSGKTFTLNRKIAGGNFKIKETKIENFQTSGSVSKDYKSQHSSTADNISSFLLNLCGFDDKYVRKNNSNAKRELSFRDISKLTLIDEERIITEKSPLYFGQYTEQTQEQSVFEILITGNDAKHLEEIEESKLFSSRIKGKIEFVDLLINNLSIKLSTESENLGGQNISIQNRVDDLTAALKDSNSQIERLTSEKQELFNELSDLESKNLFQNELLDRLMLLGEHYRSDLKRLEFITEGEQYFSQLGSISCPICGGDMDKEHYDCIINEGEKRSTIIDSIEIELHKIQIKLTDLESTIKHLQDEKSIRSTKIEVLKYKYESLKDEIQNKLEPFKSATRHEIELLAKSISESNERDLLKEQLVNYQDQRNLFEVELSRKPKLGEQPEGIQGAKLLELCQIIEAILSKWRYPNIKIVTFDTSYKVYDIKIDNKNRKANGKGVRAITYTSLILGLMDYCIKNNLPHSKTILIDSPLTTYHGKERDSNEDVSKDMQEAFFLDLINMPDDRQFIILDNKEPRINLLSRINYIHFSGDKLRGRQGFFPI
jgi:hypothetical protein